jgi:hypothetical protein
MLIDDVRAASRAASFISRLVPSLPGINPSKTIGPEWGSEVAHAAASAEADGRRVHSEGMVLYPPGRMLWLLPPERGPWWQRGRQGGGTGGHTMVATTQAAFSRFLLLPKFAYDHVPDSYLRGIADIIIASDKEAAEAVDGKAA